MIASLFLSRPKVRCLLLAPNAKCRNVLATVVIRCKDGVIGRRLVDS